MDERRGYTLIELSVILALLLVVAAVALPAFRGQREQARQAACTLNLKQLGLALLMYVQDYDLRAPAAVRGQDQEPGGRYTWPAMVYPYLKNAAIYICPSGPGRALPTHRAPLLMAEIGGAAFSYGANRVHDAPGPPTEPFVGEALDFRFMQQRVEGPGVVTFTDVSWTIFLAEIDARDPWLEYPSNEHRFNRLADPAARRHPDGSGYLFCDGHMKVLPAAQMSCNTSGGVDRCPWSVE
jgi:prepilin-type N-terminal cleavage/methylation domain-containing protein/prepilin-type processing-associated H-X9-DG protein